MNIDQLKKVNYIPNILSLIFSACMFALMALPFSQYRLLSEMTLSSQGDTLNLFIVIPAILTVFVILLYCVVFLLSLLSLFMERFYNYHFLSKVNLIAVFLSVLVEISYFIIGSIGVLAKKAQIVSFGNIITIVLNLFFLIAYIYTYKRFISVPFWELMKKVKENQIESKIEKDVELNEKEILEMLKNGKITSEEALKMLHEVDKNSKGK